MSLKKRTMIIVLAKGISQANAVLLGIIIVRMMTQKDVGTYNQAFLVYGIITSLLSLSLDASLFYFVPALKEKRLGGFVLQTCYLTWFMGLFSASVMYFGADLIANFMENPPLAPYIRTLSLFPFGEKLIILVPSFMISINRTARAGFYIFISAMTKLAMVVIVLCFKGQLDGIFQAIVIAVCLVGLIGAIDMLRFAKGSSWSISRQDIRDQIDYCFPLLITSAISLMNIQFGRVLISRYFGPETYAIYAFGAMEIPLIALVSSSMTRAIMPNLVEFNLQGKPDQMLRLWQKAMRKSAIIMFPCFAFLMPMAGDLMTLLYGKAYSDASLPFRILLCALPLRAGVYTALLRALAQTRYIAISEVRGMVVNAILSLTLIELGKNSMLGFVAPSIGGLAAQLIIVFTCLTAIKKSINKSVSELVEWHELSRLLLAFCLPALPLPFIPTGSLPLIFSIGVKGLIYCSLTLVILLKYKCLDQDEMNMLHFPLKLLGKFKPKA